MVLLIVTVRLPAFVALAAGSFFVGLGSGMKEYLNMSVPQTVATWTVLETIVSIAGLGGVLVLAALVG